jgi:hypothetical protein
MPCFLLSSAGEYGTSTLIQSCDLRSQVISDQYFYCPRTRRNEQNFRNRRESIFPLFPQLRIGGRSVRIMPGGRR